MDRTGKPQTDGQTNRIETKMDNLMFWLAVYTETHRYCVKQANQTNGRNRRKWLKEAKMWLSKAQALKPSL